MKPTDVLSSEHRVIEKVLGALDGLTERAEKTNSIDGDAVLAIDFLREYADKRHHAKEETFLFPFLVKDKGWPEHAGPIAVMLAEHEQGRALVRAMAASLESGEPSKFIDASRSFSLLLRGHIRKEDGILFPMADQSMNDEERNSLLGLFEETEKDDAGARQKYEKVAEEMGLRYPAEVSGRSAQSPGCFGGCGH
ncbi:MAG: hemerythrin domain-containing protein [Elusimicrobia bacterium]|jgi:hemerythrin-like domain-containing protein|nr:hemerythrin domain-containing protein [Elusimicrobiota bacterium]MBK7208681.1 hemerythrin domain-containing protein [Elusimicrobiota bacterium]MBK7545424.1 hemerythrin domain-containing protein [Elusimicrobiota bacterium]MBK7575560.1 hemerythrin domain-containing protein [Elusimicrobiota bacterium]MBK7688470.1 hemerythrin domain-containing protein [Elusimicrobiota bacterium]